MNSQIIKRLIAVNMLYVNPSSTNQIRKKGHKLSRPAQAFWDFIKKDSKNTHK